MERQQLESDQQRESDETPSRHTPTAWGSGEAHAYDAEELIFCRLYLKTAVYRRFVIFLTGRCLSVVLVNV